MRRIVLPLLAHCSQLTLFRVVIRKKPDVYIHKALDLLLCCSGVSGVFTVPIHGLYQISVSLLSVPDESFNFSLMRNDQILCRGHAAGE